MNYRKDNNHTAIKNHLQAIGAIVIDTADRGMSVDLVVFYRKHWFMLEVKQPSKIKKGRWESLTSKGVQNEQKFVCQIYPAPYYVVVSQEEAQGVVMRKQEYLDRCLVKPKI